MTAPEATFELSSLSRGERAVCVVEYDGALRSKSNYRRSARGSAKSGEWAAQSSFEDSLAKLALVARPKDWPIGARDDPVAQRPGYVVLIVARTTLDTANMAKSVTDALEEVLFINDASVRHVASMSVRTRQDQAATIMVEALAPGASTEAVLESAASLARDYLSTHQIST
jgi:hypothetical protein